MAHEQQGEELVTRAIALMSEYDKPTLLAILERSGSLVTELSSQDEILDASFKALKDSSRFRQDLLNYIQMVSDEGDDANFSNLFGKKEGGSAVGNALRTIFSQENISALAGAGIAYASTRLQDSASKKGNQQATDYKVAEANASLAEAKRLEAEALNNASKDGGATLPPKKGTPKWVLPVAIGGGVLVIGVILYFTLRKK
tara:strand:+ start:5753 stop:6355 length:603 start_codon:yes stop_codon:yes gene_type:complete